MSEHQSIIKERERLAAILTHEQAAMNQELARKLAFSGVPAAAAKKQLDALKKKQRVQNSSEFDGVIGALNPDLGADFDADHEPNDFTSGQALAKQLTGTTR